MKRKDLVNLVSEAINLTPALKPSEVGALMAVARNTERIAFGEFYSKTLECGCPLWQAGLVPEAVLEGKKPIDQRHLDFAVIFDRLFRHYLAVQGDCHFRGGADID